MYNIIEVRKNISSKLIFWQNGQIENPPMGYCVYNADKGYLVTTNMKNKKGQRLFSFLKGITCFLFLAQTGTGWAQKDSLYYDKESGCSWEFLIYDDHVEATGLKGEKYKEA